LTLHKLKIYRYVNSTIWTNIS